MHNGPRVAFIGLAAFGAHGGIQRFNRRVVDVLQNAGYVGHVAMLADNEQEVGAYSSATIKIMGFSGNRSLFFRTICGEILRSDILLIGHINLLPFAAIFKMFRPRGRVILFAHGIEVWGDPAYRAPRFWEPRTLRGAIDTIAIVSRYSRSLMSQAFKLPLQKFCLFPNAVDIIPEQIAPKVEPVILTVSRLASTEREKHIDKLVKAMPQVLKLVPSARLIIVGDGPLKAELQALAIEVGVERSVEMLGFVSDDYLSALYNRASVFALPSSKEGFGIVYLESWLRGLPVVGSQFGAAAEVIDNNIDGFTVDPEDIEALAVVLSRLLNDSDLALKMAGAGREKVAKYYSHLNFDNNLRDIIDSNR